MNSSQPPEAQPQPQTAPQSPPAETTTPTLVLDQATNRLLFSVLRKAEEVLDSAYEVYHGDAEQVTHKFLLKRLADANEKMDLILAELARQDKVMKDYLEQGIKELGDKQRELEERSKIFAARVSAKMKELEPPTQ
jgi:hypothetical protein